MRVLRNFDNLPQIKKPVVTIGSFDGVHSGHREILSFVREEARKRAGESVVVTFDPHPRLVIEKECDMRLLSSTSEKLALIEAEGIDNVIIAGFDGHIRNMSAEDFIKDILVGKLRMDTLMVGYNHHLGHDKSGNSDTMPAMSRKYGFRLTKMPQHSVEGSKVSSTIIRGMIQRGELSEAALYLSRDYSISGTVDNNGTLTLEEPRKVLPPPGSYTVEVTTEAGIFDAEASISFNDLITIKVPFTGQISVKFRTFAKI